jgi:hypothetical protein
MLPKTGWDVLQYEIREEQASTVGRLSRELREALDALNAVRKDDPQRGRLVDIAAYALWNFVVQRDCAGIRFTEAALRNYDVPAEVRARMGVVPPKKA